jgi:hypothetical protein
VEYKGEIIGDRMAKQAVPSYQKVLDRLALKLEMNISLCLCHGKQVNIPADLLLDKFYIFSQMLPREFEGVKVTTIDSFTINNEKVILYKEEKPAKKEETGIEEVLPDHQGVAMTFSKAPSRALFVKDDKDQIMAVLMDGALYIVNDFTHSKNKENLETSLDVFNYIINKIISDELLIKQVKVGIEEKSKRALESALRSQYAQRLEKEILTLQSAKDVIVSYEKQITDATRKVILTESIVNTIRRNISEFPTALEKVWIELGRIAKSPLYSSISFITTGIKAQTTPITVEWKGKKYSMGRYEVNLGFSGTCTIKALDFTYEGCDHPHILNNTVCWGNFSGYIPKLIGASEFDVALVQIHTFLCHYDDGNPYKRIENWPELKPESKEQEK